MGRLRIFFLLGALLTVAGASQSSLADTPKRIDGLSYHDIQMGEGDLIRPGDTALISISSFEFDVSNLLGRGRPIAAWLNPWVVAGHAALGGWNHHSYELLVVGMRVGGRRLIYAPGLYADTDAKNQKITRPFVVDVSVLQKDNDFYKRSQSRR